jgi:hypothetical protein
MPPRKNYKLVFLFPDYALFAIYNELVVSKVAVVQRGHVQTGTSVNARARGKPMANGT